MDKINNNSLFSDLKVLELSSVLAGPAVGMFFAELGAKVFKVENLQTGGDVTRSWKMGSEDLDSENSAYYHSINWNKESLKLDLSNEQDRARVHELVKDTDIVIANFKHGSAKKLKMDYASLKAINPALIYGSISAYGKNDPRPGFDVSMQAETGWVHMNGDENGPPTKMPVALIDILAAHQLKEGLLVALLNRIKSGGNKGSEVHISLFDASIASLANQASNWLNLGVLPRRTGSKHPNIAPYGDILTTNEGLQVMLTAGTQKQFELLCETFDSKELVNDPRFEKNPARLKNRSELITKLQNKISCFSFSKLAAKNPELKSLMVPIQNLEQVFQNPEAQKMVLTQSESDGSESKRVATVAFEIKE